MFPPHTRGCTGTKGLSPDLRVVSPAHAGMYRATHEISPMCSRFPRTRGDVPQSAAQKQEIIEFPPHTRGCTLITENQIGADVVSPAHAGMYRTRPART